MNSTFLEITNNTRFTALRTGNCQFFLTAIFNTQSSNKYISREQEGPLASHQPSLKDPFYSHNMSALHFSEGIKIRFWLFLNKRKHRRIPIDSVPKPQDSSNSSIQTGKEGWRGKFVFPELFQVNTKWKRKMILHIRHQVGAPVINPARNRENALFHRHCLRYMFARLMGNLQQSVYCIYIYMLRRLLFFPNPRASISLSHPLLLTDIL